MRYLNSPEKGRELRIPAKDIRILLYTQKRPDSSPPPQSNYEGDESLCQCNIPRYTKRKQIQEI
ncbi:uncharacterized protein G2W53_043930 [Senna tora]|uniref:Uncharacterized protein n=1 Tax=Senna tora TaxID=362788 RepID=A0A834SJG9_9FABA|nr:uncharacterized protein G2W53_043930 [Senna tora]